MPINTVLFSTLPCTLQNRSNNELLIITLSMKDPSFMCCGALQSRPNLEVCDVAFLF